MSTVRGLLVFEWGEIDAPPEIEAFLRSGVKRRKDGQPDKRTREGRKWWTWFREQNRIGNIDRTPKSWWKSGLFAAPKPGA